MKLMMINILKQSSIVLLSNVEMMKPVVTTPQPHK